MGVIFPHFWFFDVFFTTWYILGINFHYFSIRKHIFKVKFNLIIQFSSYRGRYKDYRGHSIFIVWFRNSLEIGLSFGDYLFIIVLNFFPASILLRSAIKKKSLGARSGENVGRTGSNSWPNSCNFAHVLIDLWHGALSWWKSTFFLQMGSFFLDLIASTTPCNSSSCWWSGRFRGKRWI
jgi:hypothetical protein